MTHTPAHAVIWTELPVRDLPTAMAFYSAVFGYALETTEMGPNPVAMLPTADGKGVAGHLYPGTPAGDGSGPTVHLAVPGPLAEAMDRCTAAGGRVISPPIEIQVGTFAYATDPDGNSLGLFEPRAA